MPRTKVTARRFSMTNKLVEEKEDEDHEEDDDYEEDSEDDDEDDPDDSDFNIEEEEDSDDDSDDSYSEGSESSDESEKKGHRGRSRKVHSSTIAYKKPRIQDNDDDDADIPRIPIVNMKKEMDIFINSRDMRHTVDCVIGNFHNALEGAREFRHNPAEMWLSENPPPNLRNGPMIFRNVSMRVPALKGHWKVGELLSNTGCCGAIFWHTQYVGPNAQAAAELIRSFTRSGMQVQENEEHPALKDKGLRLIGRYSWDYYRRYDTPGLNETAFELFDGPSCFFVPCDVYENQVYPEIVNRASKLLSGKDTRFKPYLNRIGTNGALAVFPGQEYLFAKVFLQSQYGEGPPWAGVRAILIYTQNIGDNWKDCQIEEFSCNDS